MNRWLTFCLLWLLAINARATVYTLPDTTQATFSNYMYHVVVTGDKVIMLAAAGAAQFQSRFTCLLGRFKMKLVTIILVCIGIVALVLFCGCRTNSSGWPIIWGGHQTTAHN